MSQLEANTINNTTTNFDDNMLPPAPASVKRDVTIILYNNDFVNLSHKIIDNKKDIFIDIIFFTICSKKTLHN